MKLDIDLNRNSLQNAISRLQKVSIYYPQMVKVLLQKSCEWIRDKAINYLYNSDLGTNVINEIINDFHIQNNGTYATLRNGEGRGYMIEFGIGVVGQGTYDGSVPPNYTYNVQSGYKDEDGTWCFWSDYDNLDIPQNMVEFKREFSDRALVSTKGTKGVMFMYNALTDFRSSNQAQKIWNDICRMYLR